MNQREYNSGYQAAIDEIREHIQQQRKNGKGSSQMQSPSPGGSPGDQDGNGSQQGGQQGTESLGDGRIMPSGMGGQQGNQQGQQGGQQGGQDNQPNATNGRGGGNQGVVQPSDCVGPSSINQCPGNPGGFIDRKSGDEIAKNEGYDKGEGGNDEQVARDWKDNALKVAKKLRERGNKNQSLGSDGFSDLANRLESLYKPTKDWKKELKKIVGKAITPDEFRRAYAHKNTLISQDRIARTDKDKYESMDYMVAMIDTSGSMSEKDIKTCLSELYAVALTKKPLKLVLMFFGGGPVNVQVFNTMNEYKKYFKSPRWAEGGCTDVDPCFEMLKNDPRFKRKAADLVMVFTDGYLEEVKRNPKTTKFLCWVIIDNPGFDLKYKDINTKCVHVKKEDMG